MRPAAIFSLFNCRTSVMADFEISDGEIRLVREGEMSLAQGDK